MWWVLFLLDCVVDSVVWVRLWRKTRGQAAKGIGTSETFFPSSCCLSPRIFLLLRSNRKASYSTQAIGFCLFTKVKLIQQYLNLTHGSELHRVRNFFKLSRESYLLTFCFLRGKEIISSNVAVCVHERPVFALLFVLRIKIFNSDSSRFRNESKGNFQPREYLLFEYRPSRSPVSDMFCRRTRWREAQSQEVHLIENRYWKPSLSSRNRTINIEVASQLLN